MTSCGFDVLPLAPLGASAQKDDQRLAVIAKLDSITWAEIDAVFKHTGAETLDAGKVVHVYPYQGCCHLCCGLSIEPIEPSRIAPATVRVDAFPDCDHTWMVT